MEKIRELYDKNKEFIMEVIHFGIVGVMNTALGWVIMLVLYNLLHLNYWFSTGISYFIGSIFSYHANSRVTFKVENKDKWLPYRFAANIIICYLIAFGVAKPLVKYVLSTQPTVIVENVAMILGTGIFIVLNFFGQKILVFRKTKKHQRDSEELQDS